MFAEHPQRGYEWILVPLEENGIVQSVPDDVLQGYSDTLDHLADEKHGHLKSHPDRAKLHAAKQNLERFRRCFPQPGDLVFLEEDKGRIVTMGHHFRYRWRYRTTVHAAHPDDRAAHAQADAPGLRDVLSPRPEEMTPDRPEKLSGARLLFGFVGMSQGAYSDTEPLTFGVGVGQAGGKRQRTDFAQFAGRIAFNTAVEQDAAVPLGQRFLNAGSGCLVPLRPLGAPRPSAVEYYLTQDRLDRRSDGGILCTYGDTPDDSAVGRLRGRKFYLHQPEAASNAGCYELTPRRPDWRRPTTWTSE